MIDPSTHNERVVEVPWLLGRLRRMSPRFLLDVGAADAAYTPALMATGASVTLLDARTFSGPPGARIAVGPAQAMPEAWADTFDLVVCISTIDHIGLDAYGQPADAGALRAACDELWRVTMPGGPLLLSCPVGRDLWTTHPGGGQRVFSAGALWRLFPARRWGLASQRLWRFDGAAYQPARWADVADAGYLEWRAEAVACLELVKIGGTVLC